MNPLTDNELERIAIAVEHLPKDEADREYRKRVAIRKLERNNEQKIRRTNQT